MKMQIKDIANKISEIINVSLENNFSFTDEYNLQLPFRNLEELKHFDVKIKTDATCCSRFVSSF